MMLTLIFLIMALEDDATVNEDEADNGKIELSRDICTVVQSDANIY